MIPAQVSRILASRGLTPLEFEPGSTATSQLAADRLGVQVGQIAKSLLFLGRDGRYYMLLCPGDSRASSAKLKAVLGVKTRMARPEETRAATGFEPGGVCPFGIDERIRILVDKIVFDPLVPPPPRTVYAAPGARIEPGARLSGFCSIAGGATVASDAALEDSVVLEGTRVEGPGERRREILFPGGSLKG